MKRAVDVFFGKLAEELYRSSYNTVWYLVCIYIHVL